MKYAFFLGCNIPARLEQYETASRAVMSRLGVGLIDYREFTCCGYPLRNVDRKAYLLSAAGNLALAERDGVNIMALCKCCFGTLKEAQYLLGRKGDAAREINDLLNQEICRTRARWRSNISFRFCTTMWVWKC
jgi:heterodisulfide reductase subunit B